VGDAGLELASASADSTTTCEKLQNAGGAKSGAVDAETDLTALARALLELPEADRRRLLRLLGEGGKKSGGRF